MKSKMDVIWDFLEIFRTIDITNIFYLYLPQLIVSFIYPIYYLNISRSLSGSLALFDFPLSFEVLEGLLIGVWIFDFEVAGVVDLISEGVKGSGGTEVELSKLVVEMLSEHELNGSGTLRLEERDVLPPFWTIANPGDLGSGVRDIDTPDMNSVGDLGIPVSLSYSLELSVSRGWPVFVLRGLLQILIRRLVDKPETNTEW